MSFWLLLQIWVWRPVSALSFVSTRFGMCIASPKFKLPGPSEE